MAAIEEKKEPIAYPPDNSFKEFLGNMQVSELFTPEKIQAAQTVIDTARDGSFETLRDMISLLQVAFHYGGENEKGADIERMRDTASTVRDQARLFGFTFILNVSNHLLELCCSHNMHDVRTQALMAKLVEALTLACSRRIQDDGGEMGRNLLASLRR